MNCTFFGHRDATEDVKKRLKEAILYLVNTEGVRSFMVGNNGNFDYYAQCVLQKIKKEGENISFKIVLSKIDEMALTDQSQTIFPEGFEKNLPRFAISKRNEWLIKNASFIIAYVKNKYSNSAKLVAKCAKKGLRIINLAEK